MHAWLVEKFVLEKVHEQVRHAVAENPDGVAMSQAASGEPLDGKLLDAAKAGDVEALTALLDDGAEVEAMDWFGGTALAQRLKRGRPFCDAFKPVALWRALMQSREGDYAMWADARACNPMRHSLQPICHSAASACVTAGRAMRSGGPTRHAT